MPGIRSPPATSEFERLALQRKMKSQSVFISFGRPGQIDRNLSQGQQINENNTENEHAYLRQRALPKVRPQETYYLFNLRRAGALPRNEGSHPPTASRLAIPLTDES